MASLLSVFNVILYTCRAQRTTIWTTPFHNDSFSNDWIEKDPNGGRIDDFGNCPSGDYCYRFWRGQELHRYDSTAGYYDIRIDFSFNAQDFWNNGRFELWYCTICDKHNDPLNQRGWSDLIKLRGEGQQVIPLPQSASNIDSLGIDFWADTSDNGNFAYLNDVTLSGKRIWFCITLSGFDEQYNGQWTYMGLLNERPYYQNGNNYLYHDAVFGNYHISTYFDDSTPAYYCDGGDLSCEQGWVEYDRRQSPSWVPRSAAQVQFEESCTTLRSPTAAPSKQPSFTPSTFPTTNPTIFPSLLLTSIPSKIPTHVPTNNPSNTPTNVPSPSPTLTPSTSPTNLPSSFPTNAATKNPANDDLQVSSVSPSLHPSNYPTALPSKQPTKTPNANNELFPNAFSTVDPFQGTSMNGTTGTDVAVNESTSDDGNGSPVVIFILLGCLAICLLCCAIIAIKCENANKIYEEGTIISGIKYGKSESVTEMNELNKTPGVVSMNANEESMDMILTPGAVDDYLNDDDANSDNSEKNTLGRDDTFALPMGATSTGGGTNGMLPSTTQTPIDMDEITTFGQYNHDINIDNDGFIINGDDV